MQREVDDRLRKIPTRLNEFGYDPWGLCPAQVRETVLPALVLYNYYFRVETHDIERVPPGRALLIANHAGQLPFDAAMIALAMLLEAEPPRLVRGHGGVLGLGAAVGFRVRRAQRRRVGNARHLSRDARSRASACWSSRRACAA